MIYRWGGGGGGGAGGGGGGGLRTQKFRHLPFGGRGGMAGHRFPVKVKGPKNFFQNLF